MKSFTRIHKYQLYLLQLENYELARFFRLLFKKGLGPKAGQRKELVWTAKAAAVFVSAELLMLGAGVLCMVLSLPHTGLPYSLAAGGLAFLALNAVPFAAYALAVILLMPLDYLLKKILVFRAAAKIKKLASLRVIGVAGSYGKTTFKEILAAVLASKLKVAATPESVNTPVGIARWILDRLDASVEVAIVEMGEHYQGDVEEVCAMARPDIAVITGINEAHLERMQSLDVVVDTIFEIVSCSKPGALVVLNGDDPAVVGNYQKYIWPDHVVEQYKIADLGARSFDTEALGWEAELSEAGRVKIGLLGEYALGNVSAAAKIAKRLGLDAADVRKGAEKIRPVEHRLQAIRSSGGVLVIDDAYNGNPAGASEAVKTLSRFAGRRKIFITPGLVEMGRRAGAVHEQIGRELAAVADLVILIRNSVTPFIEKGLAGEKDFSGKILWYGTAQAAHEDLKNILKPGDVIVFQNDWGDQYI